MGIRFELTVFLLADKNNNNIIVRVHTNVIVISQKECPFFHTILHGNHNKCGNFSIASCNKHGLLL